MAFPKVSPPPQPSFFPSPPHPASGYPASLSSLFLRWELATLPSIRSRRSRPPASHSSCALRALIPRIRPGSGAFRDGDGSVAGGSGGGRTAFCFSGPHDAADDGGKECEEDFFHGVFLFYGFGGKTEGDLPGFVDPTGSDGDRDPDSPRRACFMPTWCLRSSLLAVRSPTLTQTPSNRKHAY